MLLNELLPDEVSLISDYRMFKRLRDLVTNPSQMAALGKVNVHVLLYRLGLTPMLIFYFQQPHGPTSPHPIASIRAFWIQEHMEHYEEESAMVDSLVHDNMVRLVAMAKQIAYRVRLTEAEEAAIVEKVTQIKP